MVRQNSVDRVEELRCAVRRQALRNEHGLPAELAELTRQAGVLEWEWKDCFKRWAD